MDAIASQGTTTPKARPIVRRGHGETAYKRELAYERLGIDSKDVQCVPFFATQLRRIARRVNHPANRDETSTSPGRALDFLRFSEDPEARKVVDAYFSVPESYRRLLPPEAFCHAAGVSPWRVLEIIAGAAVRQGAQASAILAAIVHPRVVEKTIERALQDGGWRDCIVLHKAVGFLPNF
jgi:hypothetical protein